MLSYFVFSLNTENKFISENFKNVRCVPNYFKNKQIDEKYSAEKSTERYFKITAAVFRFSKVFAIAAVKCYNALIDLCGYSSVVEQWLPKPRVASSNLVTRSICKMIKAPAA